MVHMSNLLRNHALFVLPPLALVTVGIMFWVVSAWNAASEDA
jgi:Na+-transporting NADH:ubiquinone oxidoreductase subunit NqrD